MRGLRNRLQQITGKVDDTMMLAGSEAYESALVFYAAVKDAAKRGISGAKYVYDELRKRFPGGRRKSNPQEA